MEIRKDPQLVMLGERAKVRGNNEFHFDPSVICQSPNNLYFVFLFLTDSYLVNQEIKLKHLVQSMNQIFAFSQDSQLLGILYKSIQNFAFLEIYDLGINRSIGNFKLDPLVYLMQPNSFIIHEDSVYIAHLQGIQVFSLSQQKPIKNYNSSFYQKQRISFFNMPEKIILLQISIENTVKLKSIFGENFKHFKIFVCKKYRLFQSEILRLTKYLLVEQSQFSLYEIINGKALRKLQQLPDNPSEIRRRSIINQEIYVYNQNLYYRLNFLKGYVQKYEFEFPIYHKNPTKPRSQPPIFVDIDLKWVTLRNCKAIATFYKFEV